MTEILDQKYTRGFELVGFRGSGISQKGPSGIFDSGLILAGGTFTHKFNSTGAFDYFCMVHPWMVGIVEVE